MEEKIDGILARLSSNTDLAVRPPASRRMSRNAANSYRSPESTTYDIPFKLPKFQFSNVVFDDFQDSISKGCITFEQAEVSLQAFRTEAANFPFVVVDPTIPLDILRLKRPFLLLSILAFSAQWNVPLQSKLEMELKESLCKRVIMDGEKSLDLLQGLLVYLNWLVP